MSFEDSEKKPISVGPWGGQGGLRWDDGVSSTVRKVIIAHGSGIDSIIIEYDEKGSSVWSEKHGGQGGNKLDKVVLDYPNEFLTSIHGYYGAIYERGESTVRSLTFVSNTKTYGPFGVELGTYFSFPVTGGKIVGFHGRCSWYLDAIGIYLKPLQEKRYPKTVVQSQSYNTGGTDKVGYSVTQGSSHGSYDIVVAVRQKDSFGNPLPSVTSMQNSGSGKSKSSDSGSKVKLQLLDSEKVPHNYDVQKEVIASPPHECYFRKQVAQQNPPKPRYEGSKDKMLTTGKVPQKMVGAVGYGPWGGTGGFLFDDGTYTGIKRISLSRNDGIIAIKICYDRDGKEVGGSTHGDIGGFIFDRVIFDYPSEILTHITGAYGPVMYMGPVVIKSISFYTNKGKHGPFGEQTGSSFTSNVKAGKIVGFHGRECLFLDAIGVHAVEMDIPEWSNKSVAGMATASEEESRTKKLILYKRSSRFWGYH